jgi:hypothetical protein
MGNYRLADAWSIAICIRRTLQGERRTQAGPVFETLAQDGEQIYSVTLLLKLNARLDC